MWLHPAVQDNVELLAQRGAQFLGPAEGDQACGDVGPGRMTEPEDLVRSVIDILQTQQRSNSMQGVFEGKNVLITAGPTYEDIDPVRFIANRSSGKMGYALAQAAQQMGANVQLVSGPVRLAIPNGVERQSVRSAQEMYEAVLAALPEADIFIAAAAVADFRPAQANSEKIKKQYQYTNGTDAAATKPSAAAMTLELVANPDILAEVCARKSDTFCVGFAAETENLRDNAYVKRLRKGADLIAANWVGPDKGFDVEDNAFLVLGENFEVELPRSSKSVLAQQLMVIIAERLNLPQKLPNTSE
jgi:phosphopantothenoylcysteine decarboxylase/phosphopantothenate--cysteine ligase